jgi:hypothetical protein
VGCRGEAVAHTALAGQKARVTEFKLSATLNCQRQNIGAPHQFRLEVHSDRNFLTRGLGVWTRICAYIQHLQVKIS